MFTRLVCRTLQCMCGAKSYIRNATVAEPFFAGPQELGDARGYEAAEQASLEIAQSLPRVRTSLEEERPSAAATNGPVDKKACTHTWAPVPVCKFLVCGVNTYQMLFRYVLEDELSSSWHSLCLLVLPPLIYSSSSLSASSRCKCGVLATCLHRARRPSPSTPPRQRSANDRRRRRRWRR